MLRFGKKTDKPNRKFSGLIFSLKRISSWLAFKSSLGGESESIVPVAKKAQLIEHFAW